MYYKYITLLALLLGSTAKPMAGEVHEFTLDNGLQLIVKEDHRAPVVVTQVWYKVGASYEEAGKTGLSHMLEHMMFKGTAKYSPGEFSRIMAANGASENAFTGTDYTAYFQTLEKSRLHISFEMEADRMRHLVLTEKEFVKERQVVTEERRTRTEDKPISQTNEHFMATAYQTSPYHNPVIGWMSDIQNYTLADLEAWYQRWYAPNNATVVVVGDVEPQAVLALAKQHFGPLKPSQITPPSPRPEVEQFGLKRITIKLPAKLPYLMMGYKVPALKTIAEENQWKVYALEVLAYILDGGDSTRLSKNLVRGQQIATSASAGYDPFSRLTDLFTFSGIPTNAHTVPELEKALREQIQQLQTTLVDKAELDRIKTQLRASQVYELDSIFYQGMKIGLLETVGLDWRIFDTYLENVKAVTAEQVQAVARQYLIDKNLTIAVLEPINEENK
ncbi:peptidase M16 [Candidatus Thiomargarita nelsonii]|uniref:Peptidase M16 n=1 Tax=Candidatus Thiomargarita nelsonii TaxID=1003181 RepID=A0A0A6P8B4_9GAMM|nr:peptidase M16 [Candidatus Thiomargarita nelsonii]